MAFSASGWLPIVHPGGLNDDPAVSLGHKHAIESLQGHRVIVACVGTDFSETNRILQI